MDEWLKTWSVYTMECSSAIKNEILPFATWMDPEGITVSEITQPLPPPKKPLYGSTYMWHLRNQQNSQIQPIARWPPGRKAGEEGRDTQTSSDKSCRCDLERGDYANTTVRAWKLFRLNPESSLSIGIEGNWIMVSAFQCAQILTRYGVHLESVFQGRYASKF